MANDFDERLRALLGPKGFARGDDGRWVYVREAVPNATEEEVRVATERVRYMNEVEARGQHDMNPRLRSQWVENLLGIVEAISKDGVRARFSDAALFWIRLYGVIAERRAELQAWFNSINVDPLTHEIIPSSLLGRQLTGFRLIEAIRAKLTEDELIYADYRRHVECHPTQNSYDVRWSSRAQQLVNRRAIPAIGREFTVDELHAATVRVLRAYNSELAIAVALAQRLKDPIFALVGMVRAQTAIL